MSGEWRVASGVYEWRVASGDEREREGSFSLPRSRAAYKLLGDRRFIGSTPPPRCRGGGRRGHPLAGRRRVGVFEVHEW